MFLIQDLKNQDVESKQRDKKAKGDNNTKTLIIIYLKEYEKIKLNNEKLRVPFMNPSSEKISIEEVFTEILELIVVINEEKEIGELNIS